MYKPSIEIQWHKKVCYTENVLEMFLGLRLTYFLTAIHIVTLAQEGVKTSSAPSKKVLKWLIYPEKCVCCKKVLKLLCTLLHNRFSTFLQQTTKLL